jgi:Arc/MetJ-type ribon-helix-helix transcriptional regulator
MVINVPRKLEEQIDRLVESGKYEDTIDVLWKAVGLLAEQDKDDELDSLLAVGRAQTERGELIDYSPELRTEIRDSARRRYLDHAESDEHT